MSYSVVYRSSTKTIRKEIDCQGIANKKMRNYIEEKAYGSLGRVLVTTYFVNFSVKCSLIHILRSAV